VGRTSAKQAFSVDKSSTKPYLTATRHPIHFDDLSPIEFERMCMWLVKAEGYVDAEHVGLLGNDHGCDVKAWKLDRTCRKLWWFQCKRRAKVNRKELTGEVDKIHKHIETTKDVKPFGICFVMASSVSASTRKIIEDKCATMGYACCWWAQTELDMLVKNYPRIIDEFVGLGAVARGIRAETIQSCHQLPSATQDFTGRKAEYKKLVKVFEAGKEGSTLSCIRGMAGVGKTSLALVVANHLAEKFPDGQIFLDLRGASEQRPLSPEEAMSRVIHAFHPLETLPKDAEQLAVIYQSILHDKRVLLLFDNALDADQVRSLIPPHPCWMLITSRQRFQLPGLAPVDLDVLPKKYACQLLRRICRRIGVASDVIAELCGYLPLALRAAASLLEVRKDLSPSEFSQLLKNEQSRLRQHGREGIELSVEASLALSYRLLPKKLRQAFCMLAVFRGMIHANAAATIWQVKAETSRDRLGALLRLSLLEWEEEKQRYRLHELVRLFADGRLTMPNRREAQQRHAICFGFVLAQAHGLCLKGGDSMIEGLMLFDQEWTDIDSGHDWVVANANMDKRLGHLPSLYALACEEFFTIRLHPQKRIAWLEPALAAAKALKDDKAKGSHLTELGIAYYDWGDPRKAMKYHKSALTLARKLNSYQAEASALSNIGNCCFHIGDLKRAIRYHERSLRASREVKDRRGEGKSLGNLANAYSRLGEEEHALNYYRQQLEIAKEIGDREQEGNALSGIGATYPDPDRVSLAIECNEKALAIARKLGDKRLEAYALSGLARCQSTLGNVRNAIYLCQEALVIEQNVGDRTGECLSLNNLGVEHARLGERDHATKYWRDALVISRITKDQGCEAEILSSLGRLYLESGDYGTAESNFQEALRIFHNLARRQEEAECMGNLATVYTFLMKNDLAIEFLRQAADIFHQLEDKANEGIILCDLGDRYARTSKPELAIEYCHRALELSREAGVKKTECACLSNLANAHRHLGNAGKAKEYCEKQLRLAQDIGDKLQEANALCGLGVLWAGQDDRQKAVTSYRAAAELHGEIGDLVNKGNDLLNLAKELGLLGQQQEAVQTLEKAVDSFKAAGSPRVAEVLQLLTLMR